MNFQVEGRQEKKTKLNKEALHTYTPAHTRKIKLDPFGKCKKKNMFILNGKGMKIM